MANSASETSITLADVENWTTKHQHARAVEVCITRRSYVAVSPPPARSSHEAALSANTPTAVTNRDLAVMLLGSSCTHACISNFKED